MTHLIDLIDSLLGNDVCVEAGCNAPSTLGTSSASDALAGTSATAHRRWTAESLRKGPPARSFFPCAAPFAAPPVVPACAGTDDGNFAVR